jgi:hypothetical protein
MDPEAWLLDAEEPAARAQALMVLRGMPADHPDVRGARALSLAKGAVAGLLQGLPSPAPRDAAALYVPKYRAPYHRLVALAEVGAPGGDPRVTDLLQACLEGFAKPDGGFGRSAGHLCVTGNLVRAAFLLGHGHHAPVRRGLAWLVEQQLEDGGWNCWPDKVPHGTLDAWEALGAFAAVPLGERSAALREAAARGVEFLLGQRFGLDAGYAPWTRLHFPRHYFYDALAGLEWASALGDPKDPRLGPALDWLAAKRRPDGTWAADAQHPDAEDPDYTPHHRGYDHPVEPLVLDAPGQPSRWLTLRALAVLRRAGRA